MTPQKLRKIRLENGYTLVRVQDRSRKHGRSGISWKHLQAMETGKRNITDKIKFIYDKWGWLKNKGW